MNTALHKWARHLTSVPLFVGYAGGDLRRQSNSPCTSAGGPSEFVGPDLDGNPRIAGGTVDMGAYEFQSPRSRLSYAWLQSVTVRVGVIHRAIGGQAGRASYRVGVQE